MSQNNLIRRLSSVQFGIILGAQVIGMILAISVEIIGGANFLRWYVGFAVAHLVVISLGMFSTEKICRLLHILVVAYALILAISALDAAIISLEPLRIQYRVQVWMENPNLLGAALVAAASGAAVLSYGRHWLQAGIITITFPAIIFTGSRTALAAYVLSTGIALLLAYLRASRRQRFRWLAVGAAAVTALSATYWYANQPPPSTRNMLAASTDLLDTRWELPLGDEVSVQRTQQRGPSVGGNVFRIQAQRDIDAPSDIIIYQTLGAAQKFDGGSFVVSVFLRSDVTQRVILSSNFTSAECIVSKSWGRCVTTAAVGERPESLQFQIRFAEHETFADLYVWGPQIEAGTSATPVVHTGTTLQSELHRLGVAGRMDLPQLLVVRDEARRGLQAAAWAAFQSHPWVGAGTEGINSVYRELQSDNGNSAETGYTHAHNLLVQLLGESGIIGLVAVLLPLASSAGIAYATSGPRIIPLLAGVLILNTGDYTLFHSGGFYAYLLVVGLSSRLKQSTLKNPVFS